MSNMHARLRTYGARYFLLLLFTATAAIWYAVFSLAGHHDLRVSVFDIGQGDSILTSVTQPTKSSLSEYR
ncbi:MAG: hypothetical protein HY007_00945 [Candidatus Sungbacteria bacterium]|nr:hypothetical protein [Candidatus Sungbacteria bacterium]